MDPEVNKYDFEHGEMPDFPLEEPYYKDNGLLWTSKYNFEFEDKSKRKEKVIIHDVTLRDGDQTPGVVLLEDERVRIADALADMGVPRIEAGMPLDTAAIDIREALEHLADITGENATEAVIDRVFASFCVGK